MIFIALTVLGGVIALYFYIERRCEKKAIVELRKFFELESKEIDSIHQDYSSSYKWPILGAFEVDFINHFKYFVVKTNGEEIYARVEFVFFFYSLNVQILDEPLQG